MTNQKRQYYLITYGCDSGKKKTVSRVKEYRMVTEMVVVGDGGEEGWRLKKSNEVEKEEYGMLVVDLFINKTNKKN